MAIALDTRLFGTATVGLRPHRHRCACCGYRTLVKPAVMPLHASLPCPVCAWVSDFYQEHDTAYAGGPNQVSLRTARDNYERFGAVSASLRTLVRQPRPEEAVDHPWEH